MLILDLSWSVYVVFICNVVANLVANFQSIVFVYNMLLIKNKS